MRPPHHSGEAAPPASPPLERRDIPLGWDIAKIGSPLEKIEAMEYYSIIVSRN